DRLAARGILEACDGRLFFLDRPQRHDVDQIGRPGLAIVEDENLAVDREILALPAALAAGRDAEEAEQDKGEKQSRDKRRTHRRLPLRLACGVRSVASPCGDCRTRTCRTRGGWNCGSCPGTANGSCGRS